MGTFRFLENNNKCKAKFAITNFLDPKKEKKRIEANLVNNQLLHVQKW